MQHEDELEREQLAAQLHHERAERADLEVQLHNARRRTRRARQRLREARRAPFAGYDEGVAAIVERVKPRTMTGPAKLVPLIEATRYVVRHGIPGGIVECGVWRGGSMQAVALTLLALGEARDLHLFDTFEGMPAPTAEDTRTTGDGRVAAADLLEAADRDSNLWAVATLEDVREGMQETGYPAEHVHFHPGLVEDTTPGEAPEQIALLRLDTDWYASTRHELEVLYERLVPGGVLILDDYADWDGARRATDEWLERSGEPLLLLPMGPGRIAVKPGLLPRR